jgi:hypothetical protein
MAVFSSYYRISTGKQGKSGLGIEAQRQAVANYLNGGNLLGRPSQCTEGLDEFSYSSVYCQTHACRVGIEEESQPATTTLSSRAS